MNRKSALIGAGILSAIAVGLFLFWMLTEKSRAESQAIILQAKSVYASGHAGELAQYVALLGSMGYLIPQLSLLAGIVLLGAAVLRMSFALSRRIEGRIIRRGERNEINGQFYIAPPKTLVAQHLSDRGVGVWNFDPRYLHHNREVVDADLSTIHADQKPARPKKHSGRSTSTIRRK